MGEFEGLAAAVTGGAGGIGAETVALLRARGAKVASLDLGADDGRVADLAIATDVSSAASVDAAIDAVVARFGGLDILINCAGIAAVGDVAANDDDEWRHVLDVNVIGMARTSRAALPHLRASAHAAIVHVSSTVAWIGVPQRALYAASKGAVAALTLAMAADHVREGIRVNAVLPGTTDTQWVDRLLAGAADPVATRAALSARQPIGRLIDPAEVANAIVYLASPTSGGTTGTLLTVDGGMTALRLPT